MFHHFLVAVAMLGITATVESQQPKLVDHPLVASNLRLLETWVQTDIDYRAQPGLVIGIIHDQELIYAKGFGYADVESRSPMTPDTIFRIGSQSKTFTAIAILQLQELGRLALTDPVEKYIPGFAVGGGKTASEPITIQQLLTHTAGLPSEGTQTLHWTDLEFPTRAHIAEQVKSLTAVFSPATRRKYSNLGFALAGQIVENVSGESFNEYVTKNILLPLKMDSTSVELPKAHRQRLATGYGRRMPDGKREVIPFWDANGMAAAGGMFSTLRDLAKYVSWQMRLSAANEKEILNPSTLRQMQRVQWVDPDWKGGWGLGFQVVHRPNQDLLGHGGQVPGYFTTTYIDPKQRLGVVVLTNSMDAEPYLGQPRSISDRIFDWVGSAIVQAVKNEPVAPSEPAWERLTGTYRCMWGDRHVMVLGGKLVSVDPNEPDPKSTAFTLEPVGQSTTAFRIVDGPDPQLVGEDVVFEVADDGKTITGSKVNCTKLQRIR